MYGGVSMDIIKDDAAQTSAEMLLLFGGIIAIAVAVAVVYKTYLTGLGKTILTGTDLQNVQSSISNTSNPNSLINKLS